MTAQENLQAYIGALSGKETGASWLLDEEKIIFAPCVPNPGKILCIGLNYRRHAMESGMAIPASPVVFSKFNNSLAAHRQAIRLEKNAEQYDYEAELVAVMGRRARFISEVDALSHVFGYCNGNDLSARELQFRSSQWLLGKTLDQFMPIGPYLVTADEIGDVQSLGVRCWVNGEMRQNSNTNDMVFSVAQLISYLSQYMTLEPGDLVSTGTPEGVVFGMKEKIWLKPTDVVEIEVEGLGKLTNPMCGSS
jgi:2-keto-4-pentenoate hydratase/2-oxohepta-3-ene-1,7-dioic acid hydratase in catechol pathway